MAEDRRWVPFAHRHQGLERVADRLDAPSLLGVEPLDLAHRLDSLRGFLVIPLVEAPAHVEEPDLHERRWDLVDQHAPLRDLVEELRRPLGVALAEGFLGEPEQADALVMRERQLRRLAWQQARGLLEGLERLRPDRPSRPCAMASEINRLAAVRCLLQQRLEVAHGRLEELRAPCSSVVAVAAICTAQ